MTIAERLASIAARCTRVRQLEGLVAKKDDEATLYLYAPITPEGWGGISAQAFVNALAEARDAKTLHLRVNCVGGAFFEAKAIHNALREFPGRKVAHIDGLAASAATFIVMAADEVRSSPESTWFVHEVQGEAFGNAASLRDAADHLEKETANLVTIYAEGTGKTAEEIAPVLAKETFFNAQEALAFGWIDAIDGAEKEDAEEPEEEEEQPAAALDLPSAIAASRVAARMRAVSKPHTGQPVNTPASRAQ
jgi:ATP-dependent Clp protease, protease subunit